ncbi:uncharacterized protein Z518_09500 [Rhinocladiella mackenziei CBS 650.93]|uniref:Origin recognition complex subunit 3 n=1 Tax=Rhinocladiella mackenziei CBS 650.93 TaxID=1442369 RepID=A0A0D2GTV2_9EURO|nr:uncharacterized protein Z518_09500 [Rhinocladiella mackenziei CBS 650.93]KIX01773.1 hypothetical protein Z518_09500 [Rhinocladiella mackenziei CBS 650.93]
MDSEEVQVDENAHTGCFIFKPSKRYDDEIDHRPRKRRKSDKSTAQKTTSHEECTWPSLLGGREPPTAVQLRQDKFRQVWTKQQAKIDEIVNDVDKQFLDDILEYVRHEKNNPSSQGRVKTGLILCGPGKNAQRDLVQGWKRRRSLDAAELFIPLQPSYAPNLQSALKNVIRMAICREDKEGAGEEGYTKFLAAHKALIPMNFDLELLWRYVEKNAISRVMVYISDVETFDTNILSELISTFSSWSDRIPFILLFGISTMVELFESRLSRSTVALLDAEVFEPRQPQKRVDPLYEIYHAIQHDDDAELFLGPSALNVLAELAQDQSTTVESFTRAIKYAFMSHFFANPLSGLPSSPNTEEVWSPAISQAIRNTAGFKNLCESLATGDKDQRTQARTLLTSDETLQTAAVEAIETGQQRLRSGLAAIDTLQKIYHDLLKLDALTTLESETRLLAYLPNLTQSEIYEAIETTMAERTSAVDSKLFITGACQILSDLRNWQPIETHAFDTEIPTLNDISAALEGDDNDDATFADENSPIKAFQTLLANYLTARTLFSSATALAADDASASPSTPNPFNTTTFMGESYTYNLKYPLFAILHARARYAHERALTRPADYLGCDCCTIAKNPGSTATLHLDASSLPPTSLLLRMLNEAGNVVNVCDLWEAYRDRISPTLRAGQPKGTPNDDNNGDDADADADAADGNGLEEATERKALALFYRSLAELRQLGFVKTSKRKPGVDCIAKAAWIGL